MLGWILLASFIGGIGSVLGAATLLIFPVATRKLLIPGLVSFATGVLLAAAFISLIPEALEHTQVPASSILFAVLAGIFLFFLLEKIVLWRHCHEDHCHVHSAAGTLVLIGDSFHNFVDGITIAAAFIESPLTGIAAALAIIAHEVPQEVGDFAILLDSGYSRGRAFLFNLLSSAASILGALLGFLALSALRWLLPYILAFSAAGFIYIALSDLVPGLHKHVSFKASAVQFALLIAGVAVVCLLKTFLAH